MLSRRRERIVLLVGLIVLNVLLAWDADRLRQDYQKRSAWIYAPAPTEPASLPPSRPQAPPEAQSFAEIVNRNLFTPERISQSPKEEVKAPELPVLYGTMALGEGWFALMAPGDPSSVGLSRRVVIGQDIGGYKLVSIADSGVVVEWNGKTFNIDAADSVRRVRTLASQTRTETTPAASRGSAAAASSASRVTMVGTPNSASGPSSLTAERQKAITAGTGAPPGAPPDVPAGTVIAGKRKVIHPTPFGDQVYWVDANQPAQGEKDQ